MLDEQFPEYRDCGIWDLGTVNMKNFLLAKALGRFKGQSVDGGEWKDAYVGYQKGKGKIVE